MKTKSIKLTIFFKSGNKITKRVKSVDGKKNMQNELTSLTTEGFPESVFNLTSSLYTNIDEIEYIEVKKCLFW